VSYIPVLKLFPTGQMKEKERKNYTILVIIMQRKLEVVGLRQGFSIGYVCLRAFVVLKTKFVIVVGGHLYRRAVGIHSFGFFFRKKRQDVDLSLSVEIRRGAHKRNALIHHPFTDV